MPKKYPFYIKSTVILAGMVLFVYVLSNLQEIMVPLAFAVLLSILLNPLVNFFQFRGIPRILSILLALIIGLLVLGGVTYFLSSQIMGFSHELPQLKEKWLDLSSKGQVWIQGHFGISAAKQHNFLSQAGQKLKPVLEKTAGSLFATLMVAFLIPVYILLILYYKTLILNFIYEVFADQKSGEVNQVLSSSNVAVQSYMVGLLIEGAIVATLNSVALIILGVKYAILLGVLGAIINVLPYIGGVLATLLPILVATVTKDGYGTQIGIIIAYVVIQFADNHFLIPWVVSARVRLNALISLIAVWLGGLVWGLAGMFLAIPFIGVLKIVLDRIPEMKPWGKLLGNEIPRHHKGESQPHRRQIRLGPKKKMAPKPGNS